MIDAGPNRKTSVEPSCKLQVDGGRIATSYTSISHRGVHCCRVKIRRDMKIIRAKATRGEETANLNFLVLRVENFLNSRGLQHSGLELAMQEPRAVQAMASGNGFKRSFSYQYQKPDCVFRLSSILSQTLRRKFPEIQYSPFEPFPKMKNEFGNL